MTFRRSLLLAGLLAVVGSVHAQDRNASREFNGSPSRSARALDTGRIIVKWRKDGARTLAPSARIQQATTLTGHKMRRLASISDDIEVLHIDGGASAETTREALAKLTANPAVEYASPDLRRKAHALPNDPLIASQWYFLSIEPSALRTEQAWDVTTGSNGTVVAVLDTGVRYDHPDLLRAGAAGKLLPGYDFVSADAAGTFRAANDGNGRDVDPSDPGDWMTVAESQQPPFAGGDCLSDGEPVNSSWHGTRVSGLIAAATNNATGVAGSGWSTWVLPVRVLGKCGGFDSDIIAGMRWAAGIPVTGVPANPYPARIINLSLGGIGACSAEYQDAIDEVTARGALVVVSAGNEGGPVSAPANCVGALGVTGLRHAGSKVGFSNLGTQVGISAPGGNCVNTAPGTPCLYSITAPTNFGETTPTTSGYTDQLNRINVGTSFSAPLVSGTAALMHATNARLSPSLLISRLQSAATPFPDTPAAACHVPASDADIQNEECDCTTSTCGAGMLNAVAAVNAALRPVAAIQASSPIAPGQTVTLDAAVSTAACNRTIASYAWTVVSTPAVGLSSTNQSTTTMTAPISGQVTVRVTVTDDQNRTDSTDIIVRPTSSTTRAPLTGDACPTPITVAQDAPAPTTPTPTTPSGGISGGGGGGGGRLGIELLALSVLVLGARRRVRRRVGAPISSLRL